MTIPSIFSTRQRAAFTVIVALIAAIATFASAATPKELREERKQVQSEAAEVALQLDALNAEVDEITAALQAAQANVETQRAAVEAAQRAVKDARLAHDQAQVAIRDLEALEEQAQANLRAAAVESYVSFRGFDDIDLLGDDPWAATRAETLVDIGTGSGFEALDDMRVISAKLDHQRELAAQGAEEAAGYEAAVTLRLADLDAAVAIKEAILEDVLARQDRRLSEAAVLASLDASLSNEIHEEEQRIADAIAAALAAQTPPSGGITIPAGTDVEVTSVRGILVNSLIADNLEGLLAAMEARGFPLRGWGYRSAESQIAVRRSNCGTSEYAIWQMPSSSCRPPTARPGHSQHELGLAVDFTYKGRVISHNETAVFRALSEIAADYGFFNFPREPWHWSTTGN